MLNESTKGSFRNREATTHPDRILAKSYTLEDLCYKYCKMLRGYDFSISIGLFEANWK